MTRPSSKAVVWHTDVLARFSDVDSCLLCLTEQQVYLLGQCLEQMRWNSRWIVADGDTLPDIDSLASELEFKLMDCTDLTQDIIDAINGSETLQELIGGYSDTPIIDGDTTENASNLATDLIDDPTACDNDIIFGMALQLVEFADRLIKDLLESVKQSQKASENVGYIIKLIPVLETLPIDELFEFTSKVADDMETAYLSVSTELLKQDIACDLFCIAQDNGCNLSLEEIRDYYQDKSGEVFSYNSVLDFVGDFVSGVFVGNAVFYALNTLFFQIFAFGGKFLEYYFQDYLRVVASMYNDPNSDWDTLCAGCGWTHTFDFTVDNGGFYRIAPASGDILAFYASGQGWRYEDGLFATPDYYGRAVTIRRDFTATNITSVKATYNHTQGTWSASGTALTVNTRTSDTVDMAYNESDTQIQDGSNLVATVSGDVTSDNIRILVNASRVQSASYDGFALITKVVVTGTGTNPFI